MHTLFLPLRTHTGSLPTELITTASTATRELWEDYTKSFPLAELTENQPLLWHLLLLENFGTEADIPFLLELFKRKPVFEDMIYEEALFLLSLFVKTPAQRKEIQETIITCWKEKSKAPYHLLLELFWHNRTKEESQWLLSLFHEEGFPHVVLLAKYCAYWQKQEALPLIEECMAKETDEYRMYDLLGYKDMLITGALPHPEIARPFVERRGSWQTYYGAKPELFLDLTSLDIDSLPL
jgi:hypothetical protein